MNSTYKLIHQIRLNLIGGGYVDLLDSEVIYMSHQLAAQCYLYKGAF